MANSTLEYGYLKNIGTKTKILNFFRRIFFLSFFEKMLVNATKGQEHERMIAKLVPNHYQYAPNSLRKVKRNGINFVLDLSDLVDWWIYFGFKDLGRMELFSKVRKGGVIIDIGANIGEVSMNFAKIVGPNGKVISFEPNLSNYRRYERNLKANTFSNITLVKKGLGHVPGNYKMAINENEPGNAGSTRVVGKANNNDAFDVAEIIRLDDFLNKNPVERIDLIKIDTEGFETSVIKSGMNSLRTFKPTLFLELHDVKLREQGSSAEELVSLLRSLDYELHISGEQKILDKSVTLFDAHFDIFGIPSISTSSLKEKIKQDEA